jgi:hypothetical protein
VFSLVSCRHSPRFIQAASVAPEGWRWAALSPKSPALWEFPWWPLHLVVPFEESPG